MPNAMLQDKVSAFGLQGPVHIGVGQRLIILSSNCGSFVCLFFGG